VKVTQPSLEDSAQIHELYARYSWALDTGDTEGYVALFAPDAVVYETVPDGVREAVGHDRIREFVLRFHDNPDFPGRQHRFSQIVIDPDPQRRPDHWLVRSYVLTTESGADRPPSLFWCGYCEDVVAKLAGRWLIASRKIRPWDAGTFRDPALLPPR
jgi:SnoaL-like protein